MEEYSGHGSCANLQPQSLKPRLDTLNPKPETLNPKPQTAALGNRKPGFLEALKRYPETLNPKPQTPNPKRNPYKEPRKGTDSPERI